MLTPMEPTNKLDNHVERTDRADGGKSLTAGKTPDDDGIRCVKEQLKDA